MGISSLNNFIQPLLKNYFYFKSTNSLELPEITMVTCSEVIYVGYITIEMALKLEITYSTVCIFHNFGFSGNWKFIQKLFKAFQKASVIF